jgi:hypothetical protein
MPTPEEVFGVTREQLELAIAFAILLQALAEVEKPS